MSYRVSSTPWKVHFANFYWPGYEIGTACDSYKGYICPWADDFGSYILVAEADWGERRAYVFHTNGVTCERCLHQIAAGVNKTKVPSYEKESWYSFRKLIHKEYQLDTKVMQKKMQAKGL